MSEWKAKRFWKEAAVVEVGDRFTVELDGRPVKTPAKQAMLVPTQAMADAIAVEWDAQVDAINPNTMPVTKTANAAIDKVTVQHAEVAEMLAAYGDSDLLCYRADAPEELVERQAAQWNPMLEWAAETLGARLETRTGVIHAPQNPKSVELLRKRTYELDFFELAAFHDLVSLSGSLVLGFAAALGERPAEDLWIISRLDEIWQEELWGEDDDATSLANVKREAFIHAKRMFGLAQPILSPAF
jgi:chaperone required for assembly of F1-ATPase